VIPERFEPRELGPKTWGQELLIAETKDYIGKILTMRAGSQGPMQYHVRKDETFHLVSGRATVRWKDADGAIAEVPMRPGESYHIAPGVIHQVLADTECVFFEASTPVFDDRVPA
jgi:mannose-6-phosphate isomerase-like protein (cupin superfamily)